MKQPREVPLIESNPRDAASTVDLVKEAIDEARVLLRTEIDLARDEIRAEVGRARGVGIAMGAAALLAVLGLAMLFVALALAIKVSWVPALCIGLVLLAGAAVAGFVGYGARPKQPMAKTRERLEADVNILKEQIA